MARTGSPLINFMLALAHSGKSYEGFTAGQTDDELVERWGITHDQLALLRSGNLEAIQAAVQEDAGNTDAVVTIWIGNVPWPWIGSS